MPYTNVFTQLIMENYVKICIYIVISEKQINKEFLFILAFACVFSVNCGHRSVPSWGTGQ